MISIRNVKDIATAYWRLQKWVSSVRVERKLAAESSLRALKDFLSENEIEVIDLTGELYDPGLSVEIIHSENKGASNGDKLTIIEMIRPIILHKGSVIEFGQVVIAKDPGKLVAEEPALALAREDIVDPGRESQELPIGEKLRINSVVSMMISALTCVLVIVLFFIQTVSFNRKLIDVQNQQTALSTEFNRYRDDMDSMLGETLSGINDFDTELVGWRTYIVKPGDTLSSICVEFDIDLNSWAKVITNINDTADTNRIHTGRALLIPVTGKDKQK